MHRYEKITLSALQDPKILPQFESHTVDCPKCGYRHPVPVEYTDWHAVAETYRNAYENMMASVWAKLKEAGDAFDVPLQEYFEADRQAMLAELRVILERLKSSKQNPNL